MKEMMDIYSKSKRRNTISLLKMFAHYYRMFGIHYLKVKNLICQMKKYSWLTIVVRNIQLNSRGNSKKILRNT